MAKPLPLNAPDSMLSVVSEGLRMVISRAMLTLRVLALGVLIVCGYDCAANERECPSPPQALTNDGLRSAEKGAPDRGFLWRVTKRGHSSYLFGTLHVGRPLWFFAGPNLRAAIGATDTLAVEVDLADPTQWDQLPATVMEAMHLPDSVQARLSRQIAAACAAETTQRIKNQLMQAITLTLLAARWDDLDPAFAQEIGLGATARVTGRSIVALESLQAQLSILIPSDAVEARRLLIQTLEQLEQGSARRELRRLALAWELGRLDEFESYLQWCGCADTPEDRAYMKRLLDERNGQMIDRIDALHTQGKRVLAAVGTLHMIGGQGLPRQLAARGYIVERIVPP